MVPLLISPPAIRGRTNWLMLRGAVGHDFPALVRTGAAAAVSGAGVGAAGDWIRGVGKRKYYINIIQ